MKHTHIEPSADLWSTRHLVARVLPFLDFRWHGIGLLQAYVFEGDRELRVHIWSPRLMLDHIGESGNAHNHRFLLKSTVLVGALRHTEYRLKHDVCGDHDLYDFVHARLQTKENRADMRRLHQPCFVETESADIFQGQTYYFERGPFHSSEPLTDVVVTLCEKLCQVEQSAQVVAPIAMAPVPAFSGNDLGERRPKSLVLEAVEALRSVL